MIKPTWPVRRPQLNELLLNENIGHMQISQESRLFSAVLFSFDFPLIDFYFEWQR